MRDGISRGQLNHALGRIGYRIFAEVSDSVIYEDPNFPERLLKFNFAGGPIPKSDLQGQLDYEGVNPNVVFSEIESL